MRRKSKPMLGVVAVVLSSLVAAAAAQDSPTTPPGNQKQLQAGFPPTVALLQLMDTDKNGKVSKQEFLHFMEAEFDFADRNHDGELDPKELQHLLRHLRHPIEGPGR